MKTISASDAVRGFSELLDRVRDQGDEFTVVEDGEPVARITPVRSKPKPTLAELLHGLADLPRDASFADDLERIQCDQSGLPDDPAGRARPR